MWSDQRQGFLLPIRTFWGQVYLASRSIPLSDRNGDAISEQVTMYISGANACPIRLSSVSHDVRPEFAALLGRLLQL